MRLLLAILVSLIIGATAQGQERTITYKGESVKTTYEVDSSFLGKYAGRKKGFLQLNADGTGTYRYDYFGFALSGCKNQPISIEWGFLLNDKNNIVVFDREYGKSYPILMRSTSATSFKGCREEVLLDFILVYKDGTLEVSSSDDWKK